MKRKILRLAMVAAMLFGYTDSSQAQDCAGEGPTTNLVCTAKEVQITRVEGILDSDPGCLCSDDVVNIQLEIDVEANTNRYDVGVFFAADGGDGYTGTCSPFIMEPTNASPYLDTEGVVDDGNDYCGDLDKQSVVQFNEIIPVSCAEGPAPEGGIEFMSVTTWSIDEDDASCNMGDLTYPATKSKCNQNPLVAPIPAPDVRFSASCPGIVEFSAGATVPFEINYDNNAVVSDLQDPVALIYDYDQTFFRVDLAGSDCPGLVDDGDTVTINPTLADLTAGSSNTCMLNLIFKDEAESLCDAGQTASGGFSVVHNGVTDKTATCLSPGADASCSFICENQLAVEFKRFDVETNQLSADFSWHTTFEPLNAGFVVEMSEQGSGFVEIGTVEATRSPKQEYTFAYEVSSVGIYRFRIRQNDIDGGHVYSAVLEKAFEIEEDFHISEVYPNPLRNNGTIRVSSKAGGDVRISLRDLNGQEVISLLKTTLGASSSRAVSIDTAGLPSGIYFVYLEGENYSTSRRLTVVN